MTIDDITTKARELLATPWDYNTSDAKFNAFARNHLPAILGELDSLQRLAVSQVKEINIFIRERDEFKAKCERQEKALFILRKASGWTEQDLKAMHDSEKCL